MTTHGYEVLEMLIPQGGWVIYGDDYEGIKFIECNPIDKETFENGFALVNEFKTKKIQEQEIARQALLDRLGITADEAKLLLS